MAKMWYLTLFIPGKSNVLTLCQVTKERCKEAFWKLKNLFISFMKTQCLPVEGGHQHSPHLEGHLVDSLEVLQQGTI